MKAKEAAFSLSSRTGFASLFQEKISLAGALHLLNLSFLETEGGDLPGWREQLRLLCKHYLLLKPVASLHHPGVEHLLYCFQLNAL
jgi:hypothetical protein